MLEICVQLIAYVRDWHNIKIVHPVIYLSVHEEAVHACLLAWFIEPVLSGKVRQSSTRPGVTVSQDQLAARWRPASQQYAMLPSISPGIVWLPPKQYIFQDPQTWEQTHLSHYGVVSLVKSTPACFCHSYTAPSDTGEAYHSTNSSVDIVSLEEDIQRFLEAGVAESTTKTYNAGCNTRNSWLNGLLPHTLSQGTRLTLLFMLMWKHRG